MKSGTGTSKICNFDLPDNEKVEIWLRVRGHDLSIGGAINYVQKSFYIYA
ncbi:hypothetical protein [Streptomyces sp. NPDC000410]